MVQLGLSIMSVQLTASQVVQNLFYASYWFFYDTSDVEVFVLVLIQMQRLTQQRVFSP